ncbi:MAG: hypothetical protein QM484_03605 [Woeseiaceae bacterium]
MSLFKHFFIFALILSTSISLSGCTDSTDSDDDKAQSSEKKNDHVWKQQTDALQSAKDMAAKLQKSLDQQAEKLNGE